MPKYCKYCIKKELEKREIIKNCLEFIKQQQLIYQEMKNIIQRDDE